MLDKRKCEVGSALELNAEIRDILSLEDLDRGWEICGTLHITYARLLRELNAGIYQWELERRVGES